MKQALQKNSELTLKQALISKEMLSDTACSGSIYLACAGLLMISGIPALLVSHLWSVLDMSTLLNLPVSSSSVFRMIYFAGLGCCLPLLTMLIAFKIISSNLDRLGAVLEITDRGLCWKTNNLITELALHLTGQSAALISWDRVIAITTGETAPQLTKEFKELEQLAANLTYARLGYPGNLNFVGLKKDKLRCLLTVSINNVSSESKQNLASMITSYASKAFMTKSAVELLVGAAVETRNLSYTDIWLNVLNDKQEGETSASDPTAGDYLNDGKFKIVRKLATGGQANLFLAECEEGNVVLKEYVVSTIDSASAMFGLEEFETESTILEKISHPNCVKMSGVFATPGRAYIVLEYCKGRSLREIIDADGALEYDRVLPIAHQLADVLGYLHTLEPPVLHRDISPDNVIVMDDGGVKLIDFSVARQGESRDASDFVGKASYVSPDQFRGFVSRKNDVYGFGATLYFALTGKDPEPISQLVVPDMVIPEHVAFAAMLNKASVSSSPDLSCREIDSSSCVTETEKVCNHPGSTDLSSIIFKCTEIGASSSSYASMMDVARELEIEDRKEMASTIG